MRTYVVGNLCGIMTHREVESTGLEPNMFALAEKLGLPAHKRSFVHLAEGQYLVLRTEDAVPPEAA